MTDSKRKFLKKVKKAPREAEPEEEEKKDVMNAQVLGISKPIAGILRRARGRLTM
jgi:hypothetical protein